ncbi:MAG: DUF4350 domain-containing protein [Acidobacteriota bacterium]|nr:DUF4350 domain-containing protein [Acidobacteriota bacterium]
MQGRLAIFLSIVLVLALLVALNAASYVRVEREVASELRPDRSTTNADATGTRALYEFLQETNHQVVRWRLPPASLTNAASTSRDVVKPATMVVVGQVRRQFDNEEIDSLLRWVRQGGRLVIVDRLPPPQLLSASGRWRVAAEIVEYPQPGIRPDDADAMTAGVAPLKPAQPSLLTRDVEQVMRSRFAGRFTVYVDEKPNVTAARGMNPKASPSEAPTESPTPGTIRDDDAEDDTEIDEGDIEQGSTGAPPPPEPNPAPVEHIADGRTEGSGALLLDYFYGRGRVVVLSDPFIISNAGIGRGDNLQLAVNVVAGTGGLIAFDEFHQGRGATQNRTIAYFAGTPVLALGAQAALIVLVILWSRGRRFARPLPATRVDRRSSLEFVASMAELQQRARACDLAVENVYGRTRRALARYGGVAGDAPSAELAARVAQRSGRNAGEMESLLRACEDVIAGAPVKDREALALVARLRELERELGIRMRAREVRQVSGY